MSAPALLPARFVSRPNRFIVIARLPGGGRVRAHLPDPGRLRELLLSGAELRLRPATPGGGRRTRYTVALVRATEPPRPWVSTETGSANRLAARLLAEGRVRGLGAGWTIHAEVRHGRSRLDFRLEHPRRRPVLVEVKSVTLVEDGTARFPDAPTARGARHLRELAAVARDGGRALALFVVQRGDARRVRPAADIDPDFARALAEARRAGVLLRAAGFRLAADGRATYRGPLPVHAGPLPPAAGADALGV